MTDLNALANTSMKITIDGREFSVRRLSLEDLFGSIESEVISGYITNVQRIASTLTGDDKIRYLREATGDIPSGEELQRRVQSSMATLPGMRSILFHALKHDQPDITMEQVKSMVRITDIERLSSLVTWLIGVGDGVDDTSGSASKKEMGR